MITEIRNSYNSRFNEETYQNYVRALQENHPDQIDFRVGETPVFLTRAFTEKMLSACEGMVDVISGLNFKQISANAIPEGSAVPNENEHTHFIAFDFGICVNKNGGIEPQLIEMQGFPSLFCFEILMEEQLKKSFDIPDNFSGYFNGYNKESYIQLLKDIIIADEDPRNVVLLELFPDQQKTRIDFYCTEDLLQIKTVCLTDLIVEGNDLYYILDGARTKIHRIYNRIIFDELQQQEAHIQEKGKIFFQPLNVKWVTHPNWFFRISKFTLPFLHHSFVPDTYFLKDRLKNLPEDLENYVLKPLFSFAGQGVMIDVTEEDLRQISDPENWILQKKVQYADIIDTPDGKAKAEVRVFYFWKEGWKRPVAVHNLARLSKGKMVGVRYNLNKTWVGGTIAFFEH